MDPPMENIYASSAQDAVIEWATVYTTQTELVAETKIVTVYE